MSWIRIQDRKPEEDQRVIYYFDVVGVHRGWFSTLKEEETIYDCFYGKKGVLRNDVTHWMPDDGREELPTPPEE